MGYHTKGTHLEDAAPGYSLSPQQRRAWTLTRDGSAYNTVCMITANGSLDADRLEQALDQCINRHEILRTVYRVPTAGAMPLQVIRPNPLVAWTRLDLRALPRTDQHVEMESRYHRATQHQSDVANGPLLHITVARWSDDESRILLSAPALTVDLWSLAILAQEICRYYAGSSDNLDTTSPLQSTSRVRRIHGISRCLNGPAGPVLPNAGGPSSIFK
jgi:NRPS condensation-like uncharacterized protein